MLYHWHQSRPPYVLWVSGCEVVLYPSSHWIGKSTSVSVSCRHQWGAPSMFRVFTSLSHSFAYNSYYISFQLKHDTEWELRVISSMTYMYSKLVCVEYCVSVGDCVHTKFTFMSETTSGYSLPFPLILLYSCRHIKFTVLQSLDGKSFPLNQHNFLHQKPKWYIRSPVRYGGMPHHIRPPIRHRKPPIRYRMSHSLHRLCFCSKYHSLWGSTKAWLLWINVL